mgnify:CR=1 FL=1
MVGSLNLEWQEFQLLCNLYNVKTICKHFKLEEFKSVIVLSAQNRTVYMRWIHDNEGKFYSIDQMEEIPEGAEIHWYRYKIEQDRKDELAGIFWQEIQDFTEDKFSYTFKPDNDSSVDGIKVIIDLPSCGAYDLFLSNPELFIKDKKQEL